MQASFFLIFIVMGDLLNSFRITNLDIEDSNPTGFFRLDTITKYPQRVTGTPNPSANPGGPENFYQEYDPQNQYLDSVGGGVLDLTFDSTNLDTTNDFPNGGIPYKQDKDPTSYPSTFSTSPKRLRSLTLTS